MDNVLWDFEIETDHQILTKWLDLVLNKKKKISNYRVGLAIWVDDRIMIKENEKINKYLGLTKELNNFWNIKVTVIEIIFSVLETIPKW